MYSAIVFLPLLGALIAGAIALLGASARHPGGEPESAGNGHGHGHQTARGPQRRPMFGGGAYAEVVEHEAGVEGHAAAGSRAAEFISSGLLVVAAILSWVVFVSVGYGDAPVQRVALFQWFSSGALQADWALRVDTLTSVMLVVVTTVSALVHVYSIGYMAHDPYRPRFFAYLSLFTFAMLMLVTADNLLQLFFGWEGVGLCSYLLIGFWYERPAANAAAIKAFIVNRVGDFGFILGIVGIFALFSSVDLETIFANAPTVAGTKMAFLWGEWDALTVVSILLFIGAMGKSAQILLHTWLPDAMEGPTPVSALIHAATMVTAGVFMVARLSPLFALAPDALAVVTFIGATTAFFAATVGLVQNDIKRVIAYSTCSQLGYMFVGLGVGVASAGVFHLFTHAFFKALLFLGAGSVIHALAGEQDMRRMGGLRQKTPITYWMMVVGTLALTGFPFTAGWYSKDTIIEAAHAGHGGIAAYAFVLVLVAVALTSFYSWRLIFMTFHGTSRAEPSVMAHAHESPLVMTVPLGVLAVGALVAGIVFSGPFIGSHMADFWRGSVADLGAQEAAPPPPPPPVVSEQEIFRQAETALQAAPQPRGEGALVPAAEDEVHHPPFWVVVAPTILMALGFLVAVWFYLVSPGIPARLAAAFGPLYPFLLNKWYFDELFDLIFVRPARAIGRFFWVKGDGWLIDGFGPDGVSARVLDVTRNVVRIQSGYLYHYAFAMLVGVALLITWLMFLG